MPTSTPATIPVRVLLFASYAEQLGAEVLQLDVPAPARVETVLEQLRRRPGGDRLPPRPLVALNLTHVGPEAPVDAGDEIAVLPPLAGG